MTCVTEAPETLRILTVTHYFPAHGGGIERVAERLAVEFASRGMVIRWFSSDTDSSPAQLPPGITCVPVPATNFIERRTRLPYPLWSLRAIPQIWREAGRADAVHVHEYIYLPGILALMIARLRRRPVLITQHAALRLNLRRLNAVYESTIRFLGRLSFAAATRSVFISANVRAFFGCERSCDSRLIFNGVDIERFQPASVDGRRLARQALGLPLDAQIVLFVGRFIRKKGIHIVAALSARLPGTRWIFIGSGPDLPDPPSPNVFVAGRVEHDRLPQFYQSADVLILPSLSEGFPLVVQEALCCGAAVLSTHEVSTACPEARELVRTCATPADEQDIGGWQRALEGLLEDQEYLAARSARAEVARVLWSWERCAAEYLALFREMTHQRAGSDQTLPR